MDQIEHVIVNIGNKKMIVGVELANAEKMAGHILYMWVKLCPQLGKIKGAIDPSTLYGIWHQVDENGNHRKYLVGAEVNNIDSIPDGMQSVIISSGKYVKTTVIEHSGWIPKGWQSSGDWTKQNQMKSVLAKPFVEKYNTQQEVTEKYSVELYRPIE